MDDLPVGFNESIEHLHLKHWQHEQVKQIVTSEAIQPAQIGERQSLRGAAF
jgi:hypothetical protein